MSSEQLATRILAERARIDSHAIRTGTLSNDDFSRLVVASQELNDLPLYVDDTPAVTVSAIRTRCRRLARQNKIPGQSGLGLIIIDHLQLVAPARGERNENRVQEISGMTPRDEGSGQGPEGPGVDIVPTFPCRGKPGKQTTAIG